MADKFIISRKNMINKSKKTGTSKRAQNEHSFVIRQKEDIDGLDFWKHTGASTQKNKKRYTKKEREAYNEKKALEQKNQEKVEDIKKGLIKLEEQGEKHKYNPNKPTFKVLAEPYVAIGCLIDGDHIDQQTYKWIIPADIEFKGIKFGQIMTVSGNKKAIFAYPVKTKQKLLSDGSIDPSLRVLSFDKTWGNELQIEQLKQRSKEMVSKKSKKYEEHLAYVKETKRRARKRKQLRNKLKKLEMLKEK